MADEWLDETGDPTEVDLKTYDKLGNDRKTDGFRAGIDAGKESTLQNGFNKGYVNALQKSMEFSRLRGMFNAALCHNMVVSNEAKWISEQNVAAIQDIVEQLTKAEHSVSLDVTGLAKSHGCCGGGENTDCVQNDACGSSKGESSCSNKVVNDSASELISKANELIESVGIPH